MWIDQELEWDTTAELVEELKKDKRLKWYHIQAEFDYTNNTSNLDWFFKIWDKTQEELWVRKKSDDAIKENIFWVERFYDLFPAVLKKFWEWKVCWVGWVRVDESPMRRLWLTTQQTYKYITWGTNNWTKWFPVLYPIYDWTTKDVWKFIHDNNLPYNKLYDYQYMHWVPLVNMRCSSLIHETAINSFSYLWDVSHDLINRIEKRLPSVSSIKHNKEAFLKVPKTFPFMFMSWVDYTEYLIDNLLFWKTKEMFQKEFWRIKKFSLFNNNLTVQASVCKKIITGVLRNDDDWQYLHKADLYMRQYEHKRK